jgi:hypothetical protein
LFESSRENLRDFALLRPRFFPEDFSALKIAISQMGETLGHSLFYSQFTANLHRFCDDDISAQLAIL